MKYISSGLYNIERMISLNILVTGGAGFIGSWVVKRLLGDGHKVWVLDNLSNGNKLNLDEVNNNLNHLEFIEGDIKHIPTLERLFLNKFDLCYHLAASINVQDSIDDPITTFQNDVVGTFYVLEQCRKYNVKIVFMSTCMVYDRAKDDKGIDENHPVKPASPYAGSKIAGENMVLSYWYAYKLPAVVIRPFNTYGPKQKSSGEGGVVAIFIKRNIEGLLLNIYGDGKQTRDLLYVEDCAEFIVQAGYCDRVNGEIVNAGVGKDVSINELALMISGDRDKIKHVTHIHPQSEIPRLLCNPQKAKDLLGWHSKTSLAEGIAKTTEWIKYQSKI